MIFKNKGFDCYTKAQPPLNIKQQTIDDKMTKEFYGVSGAALQGISTTIVGGQKGERIIKDQMVCALARGNKYKKINATHLI